MRNTGWILGSFILVLTGFSCEQGSNPKSDKLNDVITIGNGAEGSSNYERVGVVDLRGSVSAAASYVVGEGKLKSVGQQIEAATSLRSPQQEAQLFWMARLNEGNLVMKNSSACGLVEIDANGRGYCGRESNVNELQKSSEVPSIAEGDALFYIDQQKALHAKLDASHSIVLSKDVEDFFANRNGDVFFKTRARDSWYYFPAQDLKASQTEVLGSPKLVFEKGLLFYGEDRNVYIFPLQDNLNLQLKAFRLYRFDSKEEKMTEAWADNLESEYKILNISARKDLKAVQGQRLYFVATYLLKQKETEPKPTSEEPTQETKATTENSPSNPTEDPENAEPKTGLFVLSPLGLNLTSLEVKDWLDVNKNIGLKISTNSDWVLVSERSASLVGEAKDYLCAMVAKKVEPEKPWVECQELKYDKNFKLSQSGLSDEGLMAAGQKTILLDDSQKEVDPKEVEDKPPLKIEVPVLRLYRPEFEGPEIQLKVTNESLLKTSALQVQVFKNEKIQKR